MATTAFVTARRNQNLYRESTKLQLGPNSATFVVIALICVLALLYLNQITKTSVLGYRVTDLTRQRDAIRAETQDLSVEAARLQSIKSTQTAVAGTMVPVGQVTYAR